MRSIAIGTAVVLMVAGTVLAVEQVPAPGTTTSYPRELTANVGGKAVKLALTGTAMRTKLFVNVYALGSYVDQGTSVKSAEALAHADCPKILHLVMERAVDGKDMAEAFRSALRQNHPEPAFTAEMGQLIQFMRANNVGKGDHVQLMHVPGVGLQIKIPGKADFAIKNVAFSKAVWEIYLGKYNIGEAIKKGLTSRL